jgi:hypothetical protein
VSNTNQRKLCTCKQKLCNINAVGARELGKFFIKN